jgi:uncharacterized protein (DUF1778 family)
MAKKASGKESAKELSLKVRLTPEEYKDVRVAAAELEMNISEFLRHAVLAHAQRSVTEYVQRGIRKAGARPSSKEG